MGFWEIVLVLGIFVSLIYLNNIWDMRVVHLENKIAEIQSSLDKIITAVEQLPDAFDIAREIEKRNRASGLPPSDSAIVDHPEWFTASRKSEPRP